MRNKSLIPPTNIPRVVGSAARIAARLNTGWLDHPSSTTSTYYGIRGSPQVLWKAMPHPQDSNWAPLAASRGTRRGDRSSAQSRGGQQGEYRMQEGQSRVDIYAAVDSWRSYSNDTNTLQSSISGQTNSNASFDPFSQVFNAQAYGTENKDLPPYRAQDPYHRSNVWYPNQVSTQIQDNQRPVGGAPYQRNLQWPPYAQRQPGAAPSHIAPSAPVRFANDLQENPQQAHQPAGGSWRGPQPTFVQQVPMRPNRGVDRSRGYSASRDQTRASIETEHAAPNRPRNGSDRRNYPRQSTPRREYIGPPPPPPPVASQAYLAQAHLQPEMLKEPRRLLVILDLNGTLMLKPDFKNPKDIRIRPGAPQLLEYLFALNSVMIFTSSQPHNAETVARALFSGVQYEKLVAIWARDKLDLTPAQYRGKVQVYKTLDKIWANNEIQANFLPRGTGKWDQTNTILVDDSHLKALQEPHNLLQVVEFTGRPNGLTKKAYNKHEEQICQSLVMKLEVLKWQKDVSRLIWRWQTGKAEIPKLPGSNFFVEDKVGQKEQARKDLEAAMNLPTPQSPVTTDSEESEEDGGSVLLTKDLEASVSPEQKRSESPVGEGVFKDLLAGGEAKARQMPTPGEPGR